MTLVSFENSYAVMHIHWWSTFNTRVNVNLYLVLLGVNVFKHIAPVSTYLMSIDIFLF